MSFLRPEFLYAYFAIIIPIAIHLFNFRRHKKLYFSDISRLKTLTLQTKKQKKLKHIVVLILRILTILAIVTALAGPIKPINKAASNSNIVTLYIDNTMSMMLEGEKGRLFETSRKKALEIIKSSAKNTSFIIISDDNSPSNLSLLDKEAAISLVEELKITSNTKDLSLILADRNRILSKNNLENSNTYIISDFQSNSVDIDSFTEDSTNQYFFIPLDHITTRNIYIDSCSLASANIMTGKVTSIDVWITNDSETDYEKVAVKLFVNEQQKAVAGVDMQAGSTKKITLNTTPNNPGWQYLRVELEDYPIIFDDKLIMAYFAVEKINILLIGKNNNNQILRNFYSSDEIFSVTEMDYGSIDFGSLNNYDLIILNQLPILVSGTINQFSEWIKNGGNLLFIPPDIKSISSVENLLRQLNAGSIIGHDTVVTRVTSLKMSNPIFSESVIKIPQNAELPTVYNYYKYNFPSKSGVETLVSMLSGYDFFSKKEIGSGNLFLLATGLKSSNSNFQSQLLFAPIMHGIASKRNNRNINLYNVLGDDQELSFTINQPPGETPYYLISNSDKQKIIPGQRVINNLLSIDLNNIDLNNDYYSLMHMDTIINVLAYNYNRKESTMDFLSSQELETICKNSAIKNYRVLNIDSNNFEEVINALQKESDFWKLFIIFALSTILFEILVLRFWK